MGELLCIWAVLMLLAGLFMRGAHSDPRTWL